MQVERRFNDLLLDNEEAFFCFLQAVIESIDHLSHLEISKHKDKFHLRLIPSLPMYNNMLLEEILKFHNMFGIQLDLSKSIKTSGSLDFSINISE